MALRPLPPNLILALVCAGVFVASLDQTVVVTALPEVMFDLEIDVTRLDDAAWIVTAYLLGFTAAMPLLGRVGDVYGHRRLYLGAVLLFATGSALVAVAQGLGWVIGARIVQALGGGAMVPAALALASARAPAARRSVVLGVVGAAAEAGSVLGPLYGGLIIDLAGWRWIFWANIPLGALLLAGLLAVKEAPLRRSRLDLRGGALATGGLALVTLALGQPSTFTFASPFSFGLLASGLTLLGLLVVAEGHVSQPLFHGTLFLSRPFLAAFTTQLLVGGALIMALVTVPLMTDTVLGHPPLEGGLRLMRFTGAIPVGAVLGGYASRWLGTRIPTILGLGLGALGFLWMSGWDLAIGEPALSLHLLTGGLGFGLVIAPILTVAVNAGGQEYRGTAAALITVARMLGMTLGLAALSAWGMGHFRALVAGLPLPLPAAGETAGLFQERLTSYQSTVTGSALAVYSAFFRTGAWLSLAAALPALLMYERRPRP